MNSCFQGTGQPDTTAACDYSRGGTCKAYGALASSFDISKPSKFHHFAVLKGADLIRSAAKGGGYLLAQYDGAGRCAHAAVGPSPLEGYSEPDHPHLLDHRGPRPPSSSIAAPAWLYPGLPDRAAHWNIKGEVEAILGGEWTLFAFPVMIVRVLRAVLLHAGTLAEAFRGGRVPLDLYIMDLVVGLAFMQGVLLYTVYQAVHGFDGLFAGLFLFFRINGDGQGPQLLHRHPRAVDAGCDRVWNDTHRLAPG